MPPTADLILANRAYLDHNTPPDGDPPPPAGSGGLLVAVSPTIARDGSTTWVGVGRGRFDLDWTDPAGREEIRLPTGGTLAHRRIFLDDATWEGHYVATANGFFWPIMHLVRAPLPRVTGYFPEPVLPSEDEWQAFCEVNIAFANAALEAGRGESCWVHDYQLGLVPQLARERGYEGRIGFFLHTPFPNFRIAREFLGGEGHARFVDWLKGILGAHLVGLQTPADVERFREAAVDLGLARRDGDALQVGERSVSVRAFAVGIDFNATVQEAAAGDLPDLLGDVERLKRPLVVGLERADYTKGIPERLRAITDLYRDGVAFSYLGIASPTREGVAAYDRYQAELERLAAEAHNASPAGSLFVNTTEALPFSQVLGLLGAADVVCTSSLSDGMNLVPLQAVAVQSTRPAAERCVVLTGQDAGVASAFAGYETDGLAPLDPLDHDSFVAVLRDAVQGNLAPISDRLVEAVRANDATRWGQRYLEALDDTAVQR